MSSHDVRFGFLGAGWIAHRALAPAVHAATGARLQAVAARDAARGAELEPAGRSYDDYRGVLSDPDVDVVYVSLSNDAHLPWTLAALEAGKHVLCEKPLGLDPTEVATMAEAARRHDRLLVEAFWYRWHPRTRRLEELLAAGELGEVSGVEADFSFAGDFSGDRSDNYRLDPGRGGGALYDVGCYAVSAAHLALGNGLQVRHAERVIGPSGVDLSAAAWLDVGAGPVAGGLVAGGPAPRAQARVRCGIAAPDRQVVTVHGTQAWAAFGAGEAFTCWHQPATLLIGAAGSAPAGGRAAPGQARVEEFEPVDAYRLMVEAVAARVRGEQAFLVDGQHSRAVSSTLAAIRAAATDVAELPPPG